MTLMGSLVDWTQLRKNIPELKDISIENSQTAKQKEKRLTRKQTPEQNIQEQQVNYKRFNMHIMGLLEGEDREIYRINI